ncbi:hypothetical protein ABID82_007293 [Methylobacterium sp. PvP062]|jgi:hypothetical protein|uniref:Uncharacterized protein n=1 Tax=Methylobacterium radiotolerans TaxID=31998 RepID=A0ABV2NP68_9HYPH|nr:MULTISPECIES: hypothetical protein [unclassified Methylobacterium]MBP2494664.1 hypothetical protein [Methylobacterium sp. PvP105]MBP2494985.1 hypothetical protein [Methylobacterium sp. PvP105]MBP2505144.1 hypothetical protein [Methylobacterium sp. PvP109]MBP2505465.1 hypothetical protein [Methylobacterium sp. PvP109]
MATDPVLTAAIGELADAVLYAAAGLAAVILVMGAVITVVASGVLHQLQDLNDHVAKVRDEGVDINVDAGAIGRSPFDAEQLVRLYGFILGLWHKRTKLKGEQIPSTERVTLDLAEAVGIELPTRQDVVGIRPNGTTVQTSLLPYGAEPIPAALDPETA